MQVVKYLTIFMVTFANAAERKLLETRESQETTKTLMTDATEDSKTKLIYTFKTILETYSDETSVSYLQATMTLQDLNTLNFVDAPKHTGAAYVAPATEEGSEEESSEEESSEETAPVVPLPDNTFSARMSVGWRNLQEDAYDVHNFDIVYDRDASKVEFTAIDGYCYGSIETQYYQVEGQNNGVDQYGKFNSTIKQWTDNKEKQTENDVSMRVYEGFNDIEIIEKTVTDRPNSELVTPQDVVQTFSVTYKKPFKAQGLTDINLQPLKFYNLTSAWGCYKYDAETRKAGNDPNALVSTVGDNPELPFYTVGCRGNWQTIQGTLIYTNFVNGVETFNDKVETVGRNEEAVEGPIEAQISVFLMDNAYKLAKTIFSVSSLVLLSI